MSGKPIQFRWKFLLQHEVVVIVPTEGATKKNNQLVRQRLTVFFNVCRFFFRCNAHVASHHLANDDTPVRGINEETIRPATPLSTPPARQLGIRHQLEMPPRFIQIGESLCRFSWLSTAPWQTACKDINVGYVL